MKIHHMVYAVKDLEDSIKEFEKLGYNRIENKIINKKRKVIIQFIKNEKYLIELVAPLNSYAQMSILIGELINIQ